MLTKVTPFSLKPERTVNIEGIMVYMGSTELMGKLGQ